MAQPFLPYMAITDVVTNFCYHGTVQRYRLIEYFEFLPTVHDTETPNLDDLVLKVSIHEYCNHIELWGESRK